MIRDSIDWPTFIGKQDLEWDELPQAWDEGPFLGNGMLGAMVYQDPESGLLKAEVCRSDVQDQRPPASRRFGEAPGSAGYERARLPIGYFLLETRGKPIGGTMRLDLWNAQAVIRLQTEQGAIELTIIVPSDEMMIAVEWRDLEGEVDCSWCWHPHEAISPRQSWGRKFRDPGRIMLDYASNPEPYAMAVEPVQLWVQPLLAGGDMATGWIQTTDGDVQRLFVTTQLRFPEPGAADDARALLLTLRERDYAELVGRHRQWWHAYYPQSWLSLPDSRMEQFYWLQMYKLASATRADRALIDNHGPWLEETPWPYATWNLNVQLTYWPLYASNRLELAESLWRTLMAHQEELTNNVPLEYRHDSMAIGTAADLSCISTVGIPGDQGPELGNLLWALHNVWLHYRMSMDERLLHDVLYPLLQAACNYYLHFLTYEADGKLHLPKTYSPEYPEKSSDCNYDLALLKWAVSTLPDICRRLTISDEKEDKWREVLQHLTEYPEDPDTGFRIGREVAYTRSHRHFSHLLMVYPLYLVHTEQAGGKERIVKSLKQWQSLPDKLRGYSFTGAASICAAIGEGNDALAYLESFMERFLSLNTMYKEGGPVIETPLSAAQSVHDMLLQSWGNRIRIFPAVPDKWKDVQFHDFRAEGAFLVSASRKNGETEWVRIKSLAGEPCRIRAPWKQPVYVWRSPDDKWQLPATGDEFDFELRQGEEVILAPGEPEAGWQLQPIPAVH